MEWGFELWDQFDQVINNANRNHDQNERVIHFFKDRCSIERDYAKSLKKLIHNFNQKKKEDDDFTVNQGMSKFCKELYDKAGQHETIADRIFELIIKNLNAFQVESKQNRKKSLHEGGKLQNQLQTQLDKLDKAKKKYEKAFYEAEKSVETYKKNEQDMNLAKIEIDKSRQVMQGRQQCSEDAMKDYAYERSSTNKLQHEHYHKLMPEVFMQLQQQEETRVMRVKEAIEVMASIETDVVPIVNRCIEGFTAAGNLIKPQEDIKLTIEKYKTGFPMPQDLPFDDLSNATTTSSSNNNQHNNPFNNNTAKSTGKARMGKKQKPGIFGKFMGKYEESKEDFSHLPPNQQRKQLLSKLHRITSDLSKLAQEREALNKMRDVYSNNTNLGDPASIDAKLAENATATHNLEAEQTKFKGYLADSERTYDSPGTSPAMGRRGDEDSSSLNSRVSAVSINSGQQQEQHQQQQSLKVPQQQQQQRKSLDNRQDSFSDDDFTDDFEGTKCIALYDYEGTGDDSSLAMVTGETFVFLVDEGDGWMKVRQQSTGKEGYVPSSYVQLT